MTDSYLLLTPILVLGVLALIRFIGCHLLFGLDEVSLPEPTVAPPPFDVTAVPGDQRVDISWTYNPGEAQSFTVVYGTVMGGPYTDEVTVLSGPDSRYTKQITERTDGTRLVNGTTYYFVVTGDSGNSLRVIDNSVEVSATPGVTEFVKTGVVLGPTFNNFTGLLGMAITIGPADVVVTQLGRIVVTGNNQPHVVKIVDATDPNGEMGSVVIQMPAGSVGSFAFAPLMQTVTLRASQQYFIVSHEESGRDAWHQLPNTAMTTSVATINSGIFSDDAAPGFTPAGMQNEMLGPVNFRY